MATHTRRTLTIRPRTPSTPRTLAPSVPYNPSISLPAARAFMSIAATAESSRPCVGPTEAALDNALIRLRADAKKVLALPAPTPNQRIVEACEARAMHTPTPADASALLLITQAQVDRLFEIQSTLERSQDVAAALMIMELITEIKQQN